MEFAILSGPTNEFARRDPGSGGLRRAATRREGQIEAVREITDVVVVGGGGAGMAAASEAARLGRKVVLLEKNDTLGGSTAWSVGSISATCTPHQLRRGIVDSPDEHFEDLEKLAGASANRDNRELRRILVDHTNEMFEWLRSTGLVFVGPNEEPPHRYPRMHNVLPNSKAFPARLGRHCRKLGVDIRLRTKATSLIRDGARVIGVKTRGPDGREGEIAVHGGVVLASGDYSASAALKQQFAGEDAARLDPVNDTATGDGFPLALAVGATVVNGDIVRGPAMRFIPPTKRNLLQLLPPHPWITQLMRFSFDLLPPALLRPFVMSFLTTALGLSGEMFKRGAILVNRAGMRFTDELAKPAGAVPLQPEKLAFIVFDQRLAQEFSAWPYFVSTAPGVAYAYVEDYRRNRPDIFHRADTIERLAASLGAPADALKATIVATNKTRGSGEPAALLQPPFYALGPVKSYVVFTDGGLKVTPRLEVVNTAGAVIPGLYAAGSTGQGGLLLEGHGHHLGWAFISGRIAGRNAAYEASGARLTKEPAAGAA
jgi:succinate dehydrogenase/fumarate reductase flavoprotein subunit